MIFGGYRNRQFMWLRLVMIAMLILAIVVFKGHGAAYVAFRVGYLVILASLILFRMGSVRNRRPRDRYEPHPNSSTGYHDLPTATPPSTVPPATPPPGSGSPSAPPTGLTWGGLPSEEPPTSPPTF